VRSNASKDNNQNLFEKKRRVLDITKIPEIQQKDKLGGVYALKLKKAVNENGQNHIISTSSNNKKPLTESTHASSRCGWLGVNNQNDLR
jgi:hypothetical protein